MYFVIQKIKTYEMITIQIVKNINFYFQKCYSAKTIFSKTLEVFLI